MLAVEELFNRVDAQALTHSAMSLLTIPSPTGHTAEATDCYSDLLRESGCEVVRYDDTPEAPTLAGWLRGADGPTLQFDGHIDHVNIPHDPPCVDGGTIRGRGSTDMKCSLAVCVEILRVIQESGMKIPGSLLFTTHGQHEAPDGHGEGLSALIARGVRGDAAIVVEGPSDLLAIAGRGMSIFNIEITRQGEVSHENETERDTPHPIVAAAELVTALNDYRKEIGNITRPLVGHETLFVGQIHGGDFYNRFPNSVTLQGTRRYVADHSFEDVLQEMEAICKKVAERTGTDIALYLDRIRDGYVVAEEENIVSCIREAHLAVTGEALPLGAFSSVADISLLVREAKIPTLLYGNGGFNPHGDNEHVAVESLVRQARVLLGTLCRFFGISP